MRSDWQLTLFRRLVCWLAAVLVTATAHAESSLTDVQIGLQGYARPGNWTPLRATVQSSESGSVRLEAVSADPTGHPVVFPGEPFALTAGTAVPATVFFQPGRLETTTTLRLVDADSGAVLASQRIASFQGAGSNRTSIPFTVLRHDVPLWLVAAPAEALAAPEPESGAGGRTLADTLTELRDQGVTILELTETSGLPEDARGLSVCSALILTGDVVLTARQSEVIRQWVERGGHLILAIGSHADSVRTSPLAEWALIDTTLSSMTLSDLAGLEALASSSYRIPVASRIPGTVIRRADGRTLASGIDGDLLTQSAVGFGRVTLLGIDPGRPPLSRWRGLAAFLARLADADSDEGIVVTRSTSGRISTTGISELASQMYAGMETFDAVSNRSRLSVRVLGLTLLYLLIVGPLDFLLVHRVLKRPRATWVTFPLLVLFAGLLASASAGRANGSRMQANLMDVVDIDGAGGSIRQTTWSAVYSPESRRYQLAVQPDIEALAGTGSAAAPPEISWFSMPETTFGGMYRPIGLELGRPGYRFRPDHAALEDVPVPVWSDRVMISEAFHDHRNPRPLVDSQLKRAATGLLSPESFLTHQLTVPIEDWLIVYGNRVYLHSVTGGTSREASILRPGQKWSPIDASVTSRELRSFMTGTVYQKLEQKPLTGSDYSVTQSAWDSRSTDLTMIMRMLTYHSLTGGSAYTGLTNEMLSRLRSER